MICFSSGNLINSVGQQGSNPGEFKEPAFVCIGRNDDIIISDCRNSRVQVLNKFGEFQYQIGSKGSGKGQLQGPSGVTTDRYGHILVTDRVNNRIQVNHNTKCRSTLVDKIKVREFPNPVITTYMIS